MKLREEGMRVLRELADRMSVESLHRAGFHFNTLVENHKMLIESWPKVSTMNAKDKADSRAYAVRLLQHAAESIIRDLGSIDVKSVPPPASNPDALAFMIEVRLDSESGEGPPGILTRKILDNNIKMFAHLFRTLADQDTPPVLTEISMSTVPLEEFRETHQMLAEQLELLSLAATARGVPLPLAPVPLAAWVPPAGAAGH